MTSGHSYTQETSHRVLTSNAVKFDIDSRAFHYNGGITSSAPFPAKTANIKQNKLAPGTRLLLLIPYHRGLYPLRETSTRPHARKITRLVVIHIEHDIRSPVGTLIIRVVAVVLDDQRAVRAGALGGDVEPGVALLGRLVAVSAALGRATETLELKVPVLPVADADPVNVGG